MGVYNNNKDGTRSTLANTIQVVDAPMEQFLSRGEFSAVTPNDVSADNKLVAENEVTKAVDTMPTASSSLVGTIVQYVGITTANYTNGYFYKCVSDGAVTPTYSWVEVISGGGGSSTLANLTDVELTNLLDNDILKYDTTTHKWINDAPEEGSLVSAVISKDTMPTASVDYNRIAVLFTGTTTSNYTQGHIYLCTEVSGSYTWVELTQGGGVASVDDWSQRVNAITFPEKSASETYYHNYMYFDYILKDGDYEIFKVILPRNSGKLVSGYPKLETNRITTANWYPHNMNNSGVPSSSSSHFIESYIIVINHVDGAEFNLRIHYQGNGSGYATNDNFFYYQRCNLNHDEKVALATELLADPNVIAQSITLG